MVQYAYNEWCSTFQLDVTKSVATNLIMWLQMSEIRSELIRVRVKPVLLEALKEMSKRRGVPLSKVVRSALVEYVDRSRSLGD